MKLVLPLEEKTRKSNQPGMLCIVSNDTLVFYFVIDTNICFPCEVIDKEFEKRLLSKLLLVCLFIDST